MRLAGVHVVSETLEATVLKPANRSFDVQLLMDGTNLYHPVRWRVLNVSLLNLRSPWLRFSSVEGEVDPEVIMRASNNIIVKVGLFSVGLAERAAPYVETVPIFVWTGQPHSSRTRVFEVSMAVRTTTHHIVWGSVVGGFCSMTNRSESDSLISATLLVPERASFTACDVDDIPVGHSLPSPTDARLFIATIEGKEQSIEYYGGGMYLAKLLINRHGSFYLDIQLGELRWRHPGRGYCPNGEVQIADGTCGCAAGEEPVGSRCLPCKVGTRKAEVGNSPCAKESGAYWPYPVIGSGIVCFIAASCLLCLCAEKARRKRELELERNFMAIT